MTNAKGNSNKPVAVFDRRGISASVFRNVSDENRTFYKVQLMRNYKSGDNWQSTPTFSRDDLPVAIMLANKAWEYILERESKSQANRGEE